MKVSGPLKPLSRATIKRAEDADPNSRRCLIENSPTNLAIQAVHVVDRNLSRLQGVMEGLEWGWMMMKGSINLDSRSNVFFLGASMHQLFRDMKWVLLPESDVVVRYYDDDFLLDREDLPKIEGDVFKYIFVPIRDMEDIYVTRSSSEEDDGRITVYQYPFDNFPMITSHIHPKYAVFHAGEAISRYLDRPRKISLIQRYPWVQQVERLYRTWAGCLPAESKDDAIYNAIGSVMSHDSRSLDHTPLLRIRPLDPLDIPQQFVPTHRNTSNDYLSRTTAVNMPVRKSNRRKRPRDDDGDSPRPQKRLKLTTVALQTQAKSESLFVVDWTSDRVLSWARTCRSSSPIPVSMPAPTSSLALASTTRLPLRRSERLKSKLRKS